MKKFLLLGLAVSFAVGVTVKAFADEVNMDVPYGDREPGGYQHLTTHYHNYWRHHHHPWSNIERERHVVREAQDLEKLTRIYEGVQRERFVTMSDEKVRDRFNQFMMNSARSDYSSELHPMFLEQIKNRPQMDPSTREAVQLHAFLPKPLSYNDITYLPAEFTRKELRMPDQRFRSGLLGNDLILYDEVTGRVRGIWRDITTN